LTAADRELIMKGHIYSSGKISGFAAAAVMPFFGQQPAGCVPRYP
jgi:hypothetical protein